MGHTRNTKVFVFELGKDTGASRSYWVGSWHARCVGIFLVHIVILDFGTWFIKDYQLIVETVDAGSRTGIHFKITELKHLLGTPLTIKWVINKTPIIAVTLLLSGVNWCMGSSKSLESWRLAVTECKTLLTSAILEQQTLLFGWFFSVALFVSDPNPGTDCILLWTIDMTFDWSLWQTLLLGKRRNDPTLFSVFFDLFFL